MGIFRRIGYRWHDFTRGIGNLIRWAPVVWGDCSWDWEGFIPIIEHKLKRLAHDVENGCGALRERDAKRMRVCIALCQRIKADDYLYRHQYFGGTGERFGIARGRYRIKDDPDSASSRDFHYLMHLMNKHLRGWWD